MRAMLRLTALTLCLLTSGAGLAAAQSGPPGHGPRGFRLIWAYAGSTGPLMPWFPRGYRGRGALEASFHD